jgi:hypothetical protein
VWMPSRGGMPTMPENAGVSIPARARLSQMPDEVDVGDAQQPSITSLLHGLGLGGLFRAGANFNLGAQQPNYSGGLLGIFFNREVFK